MTTRITLAAAEGLSKAGIESMTAKNMPSFENLPPSVQAEVRTNTGCKSQEELEGAGIPMFGEYAKMALQKFLLAKAGKQRGGKRTFSLDLGAKGTIKLKGIRPGKWGTIWMYPMEAVEVFVLRRQEILEFLSDNDDRLPRNFEEAKMMGYKDASGAEIPEEKQKIRTRSQLGLDCTPLIDPELLK